MSDNSSHDRVRQAADPKSSPETLHRLAQDPDVIVRAALVVNSACDQGIAALLAHDRDERVRALLAARIKTPFRRSADGEHALQNMQVVLDALAQDRALKVRATLATAVKEMVDAPHDVVVRLAHDRAMEVSKPIIRQSPVLTDGDLLDLLARPPFPETAMAIASRPSVSSLVSDALIERADAPAIRTLLANPAANIKEGALDAIVGRAPAHPDWHSPLVQRPYLSHRAIRAMSDFVAADLLRRLASRDDLDPAALADLRGHLSGGDPSDLERLLIAEAETLKAEGGLDERAVLDAATSGDSLRMLALLAVAGNVPISMLQRMMERRSAKAIVSYVWHCGFTMRVAVTVQTIGAQLGPRAVLRPTAQGDFPLTSEEMKWQIDVLRGTVPQDANELALETAGG